MVYVCFTVREKHETSAVSWYSGIALGSQTEPSAKILEWKAVPEDAETPVVAYMENFF